MIEGWKSEPRFHCSPTQVSAGKQEVCGERELWDPADADER
jgi:hypothetical protein